MDDHCSSCWLRLGEVLENMMMVQKDKPSSSRLVLRAKMLLWARVNADEREAASKGT